MCKFCESKPMIKLFNKNYCNFCFVKYFEKKFLKTVRVNNLIKKGEHIGIAVSGGKDSMSLLYLLNKLEKKKYFRLTAIAIDEGIKGYRKKKLIGLKKFCKKENINLKIYSFEEEFKYSLDKMTKKLKENPCTICGVFRRYLLNKKAYKLKLDKLATAHNLDDEAQSILMNQFKNDVKRSARLGIITGVRSDKKFVRRIKPFYFLSEKEVAAYSFIRKLNVDYVECPYSVESFRDDVRNFLNKFEEKYPGTKHSIINSFLKILPLLKENIEKEEISYCKKCKEPSSSEVCKTCDLLEKLS